MAPYLIAIGKLTIVVLVWAMAAITSNVVVLAAPLTSSQRAVLESIAAGASGAAGWPGLTVPKQAALAKKVRSYESNYQAYHLPNGLNADIWWTTQNRTQIAEFPFTGYDRLGDSVTWMGHYLAALALKYRVTSDSVRRAQLRSNMHGLLDSLDMITKVSGTEGFVVRHSVPLVDSNPVVSSMFLSYYTDYNHSKNPVRQFPTLGPDAFVGVYNNQPYAWLGATEWNTYAGVNFGLATLLAKVDDPQIRNKAGAIIQSIVEDLVANDWFFRDGKGGAGAIGGALNSVRMPVTSTLKSELMRTAAEFNPLQWGNDYVAAASSAPNTSSMATGRNYFTNNLEMTIVYTLALLEDDLPQFQQKWRNRLAAKWNQVDDHLNALGPEAGLVYPGLDLIKPYWMAADAGAIPEPSFALVQFMARPMMLRRRI